MYLMAHRGCDFQRRDFKEGVSLEAAKQTLDRLWQGSEELELDSMELYDDNGKEIYCKERN